MRKPRDEELELPWDTVAVNDSPCSSSAEGLTGKRQCSMLSGANGRVHKTSGL